MIRVEANQTLITVFEGQVAAANDLGRLVLTAGQSAATEAGRPPEPRILVRPRDAVQWALHYPPVLAVLGGHVERAPADLPSPLAEVVQLAGRNDVVGAIDVLDRVPAEQRDARYHLYRATLLLSVGRVDEARDRIEQALVRDPEAGLALALRAVINVVQNERDRALADALRAVELSPRAAAQIALPRPAGQIPTRRRTRHPLPGGRAAAGGRACLGAAGRAVADARLPGPGPRRRGEGRSTATGTGPRAGRSRLCGAGGVSFDYTAVLFTAAFFTAVVQVTKVKLFRSPGPRPSLCSRRKILD